jgi:hypothetical protein
VQDDTALMTDATFRKNHILWRDGTSWQFVLAVFAGPITNPHPWLPASHIKPGQIYLRA